MLPIRPITRPLPPGEHAESLALTMPNSKPIHEPAAAPPGNPAGEIVADLPSPRRPVTIGVLSLWLVGWGFGVVFMVQQLLLPGPFGADRAFLFAWLLLWVAAGFGVMAYIVWLHAGRERVSIEGDSLVIRHGVFGLWRARRWPLASIRRLRPFGREIPPMIALSLDFSGRGATGVRFESGGQVVRFARTLNEHDARSLVDRLRARPEFEREPHADDPGQPHSQPAA